MKKNLNRRTFLKASGMAGAAIGSAGLGFFGYESGKDLNTYTGCVDFQGAEQSFNRKKYAVDQPHYQKVGKTSRVDARTGVVFSRFYSLMNQWTDEKGILGLNPLLRNYYQSHPNDLKLDLRLIREISSKRMKDKKKYGQKFILSNAWSKAMGAVKPFPVR
ncbi:MAG: twin-arginine translocation signal domain-containing protein, partial [Candidatus Aminicenantes bacterium]|nr:twin-arginine translocation signal domain-containing protein [Candidatus Aminicenantes bacterium]